MNSTENLFNLLYESNISDNVKSDIIDNVLEYSGESILFNNISESENDYEELLEFFYEIAHEDLPVEIKEGLLDECLSGIDENIINVVTDEFMKISVQEAIIERLVELNQIPISLTEEIINEVSIGYGLKKSLGGLVQRLGKSFQANKELKNMEKPIGLAGVRKIADKIEDAQKANQRKNIAAETVKSILTGKARLGNRIGSKTNTNKAETKKEEVKNNLATVETPKAETKKEEIKAIEGNKNNLTVAPMGKLNKPGKDASPEEKIAYYSNRLKEIKNNPLFTEGHKKGQEKIYKKYIKNAIAKKRAKDKVVSVSNKGTQTSAQNLAGKIDQEAGIDSKK